MSYTIWRRVYGGQDWESTGLQLDSEKLADQSFSMYPLAPGEKIQLRAPDGSVIDERIDMSRPHDPSDVKL